LRKVQIGDCRLIHGDCLEIMPTLDKVDAVVTDPPYGIGNKMGGGSWSYKTEMSIWDKEAKQEWVDYILSLGVPSIIFGGNYFKVPASRCWLSWCKPYFPSMADFELAWTNMDKPSKRIIANRSPDGEKQHPTQKPVGVMEWCINQLPDNTETILDPFVGSGTTGVACAKLGRKFIGIELDEDYFNIACERIREAYKQPDLFIEQPKQFKQEALFDE
jgi:DNA modification methylase